jgi:hypothetical protein
VGCGGATRALDRGWEAAMAAVDGEPRQRRSSAGVVKRRKKGEAMRCSGVCKRS